MRVKHLTNIREQLIKLETEIHARIKQTHSTAHSFIGNEHMHDIYIARAQGQYDAMSMLQRYIDTLDATGAFDVEGSN